MSGEQWGEVVERALWAENHANLCGCKKWPDECVTYPGGAKAIHFTVNTEDVLRIAAPLIVDATRRKVAEELRAEAERLDIADDPFALDMALAAHWLTNRDAAIARGSGNGDSTHDEETK